MSDQLSDDELVRMIQEGYDERTKALKILYLDTKVRSSVRNLSKQGNSTLEFDDLLQETFIIFDRNIRNNRFEGKSNIRTYLIGIAKWLLIGKSRKKTEITVEDNPGELFDLPDWYTLDSEDERVWLIRKLINQMGDRCQQLLRLWSEEVVMKQIAKTFDMKDAEAAKKEVYRCRERLKKLFSEAGKKDKP